MSLDDDTYNASTLTILDDHAFKSGLITMMSDTGPETNELKCRAKVILRVMGSTLTSVHGVRTAGLLDAMIEGSEQAGLSSGVRYAAAAIIVAYQKGEASDSSASELTKLAQDWLLFFLWPFRKPLRAGDSPQSEISTPTLRTCEVIADTLPATSRGSRFRNLISEREGNKCAVSGTLDTHKGPYPRGNGLHVGFLETVHILPKSIVHEHSGDNPTIDIIKQYTNLPASIMDDVTDIIDNPVNGMLLERTMHFDFNSCMWCLHPTDVLHKYAVHWLRPNRGWCQTFTEIQFQNHNDRTEIPLPDPRFIALHAAVAHILHLSGAAEVIDKVYYMFSYDDPTMPSRNRASADDLRIRLSLIELMIERDQDQLPTNPHGIHSH
ncbi:hypothetical protein BD769DRAFT_1420803 [Suillus cothurnatus]|nr:hypothetical protein BD769DRAFT_1420803 [Suillus cothurnatus]